MLKLSPEARAVEEQWRLLLSPAKEELQFRVLRMKATEEVHVLSPLPRLVPATGNILSPLPRLMPAAGIFSLSFCDWCPLRVSALSLSARLVPAAGIFCGCSF